MRDVSDEEALREDVGRLRELILGLGRRRSLRDPVAMALEKMELTGPQLHGLLWLGTDGPLTMGELARRLGITEKTVTGVVDRLERAGYLQRERNETDRRVVRTRLTRQGATLFRKLDGHMAASLGRILGILDPADRRELFRILNNLLARLASGDAAASVKEGKQ